MHPNECTAVAVDADAKPPRNLELGLENTPSSVCAQDGRVYLFVYQVTAAERRRRRRRHAKCIFYAILCCIVVAVVVGAYGSV